MEASRVGLGKPFSEGHSQERFHTEYLPTPLPAPPPDELPQHPLHFN